MAARERLPAAVYEYFAGGSGREQTLAAAASAWREVALRPRVLREVSAVTAATTVLGAPVASPVLAAPTALLRLLHPEGETAWAAGVAAAGGLAVLSSRTSVPIADVAAADPWWFQVYVLRDRELTAELVRRAVAAGALALVLTGDAPRLGRKRRAERPEVDPAWFLPDLGDIGQEDPRAEQDPAVGFEAIEWLRGLSGLPVLVKGVLRADDARACLAAGAAGVIVSNHGGRQLDGAVSTARALGEVADAVGGEGEVLVDGGIRSGVDVLRALALGARAVLVGRPLAWGLATGGADGVLNVLAALAADVEGALALAGCASVTEAAGAELVAG